MAQSLLLPVGLSTLSLNQLHSSTSLSPRLLAAPLPSSTADNTRLFLHRTGFRLNAAPGTLRGVEPDLLEAMDYIQDSEYLTYGELEEDDFPYGKADGSHTWHEHDEQIGPIEALRKKIERAGGPNDHSGQGVISWLYLPTIFTGMAFDVQGEYLFLVGVLFIFAFIGMEMAKPNKPSNFEYDKNDPKTWFKP